jgi:hypothetical protein
MFVNDTTHCVYGPTKHVLPGVRVPTAEILITPWYLASYRTVTLRRQSEAMTHKKLLDSFTNRRAGLLRKQAD